MTREITITKGLTVVVSTCDFERVNKYKWQASFESNGKKVYAIRWQQRNGVRSKIRLHRFILDLPPGKDDPLERVVNHINNDGLDCRRENLEICSQRVNMLKVPGWKRAEGYATPEDLV